LYFVNVLREYAEKVAFKKQSVANRGTAKEHRMTRGSMADAQWDDRGIALARELRARAAELVPILQQRDAATNAARKVLPETIADFEQAGFFRILQPRKYGGYELPVDVYCDIARALAQGCMSSAWVYGVIAVHNWQMALFDDRAGCADAGPFRAVPTIAIG
jgi:alkylation response protein AidB-like acyl-CoA dehydrogenase